MNDHLKIFEKTLNDISEQKLKLTKINLIDKFDEKKHLDILKSYMLDTFLLQEKIINIRNAVRKHFIEVSSMIAFADREDGKLNAVYTYNNLCTSTSSNLISFVTILTDFENCKLIALNAEKIIIHIFCIMLNKQIIIVNNKIDEIMQDLDYIVVKSREIFCCLKDYFGRDHNHMVS